jgi:RNA polymerase sigma-70 factor (ECF subfamily)
MASSLTWTVPGSWQTANAADTGKTAGTSPPIRAVSMPDADRRPLDELDERGLVDACLAGQTGAFDLIVERHRRAVYQLCYRFVGSHEDASDLSQDVFLRAYRGLRSFRGQSTLATWLYRIGTNVCLNRVTARTTLGKLTEPIEEKQFVDVRAESPSELMLKDERAARVRAAIAQLPRKQRATLILRTYHEMSHQEIADVLGSSVGAVKANFFHALGNLKKLLAEDH